MVVVQTILFIIVLVPFLLHWLGLSLWDFFPEESRNHWIPQRSTAMMYLLMLWSGLVVLLAIISR